MNPKTGTCIFALALFAALAIPSQLSAQQPRYKLVDVGTLGGPNSYQPCFCRVREAEMAAKRLKFGQRESTRRRQRVLPNCRTLK